MGLIVQGIGYLFLLLLLGGAIGVIKMIIIPAFAAIGYSMLYLLLGGGLGGALLIFIIAKVMRK